LNSITYKHICLLNLYSWKKRPTKNSQKRNLKNLNQMLIQLIEEWSKEELSKATLKKLKEKEERLCMEQEHHPKYLTRLPSHPEELGEMEWTSQLSKWTPRSIQNLVRIGLSLVKLQSGKPYLMLLSCFLLDTLVWQVCFT